MNMEANILEHLLYIYKHWDKHLRRQSSESCAIIIPVLQMRGWRYWEARSLDAVTLSQLVTEPGVKPE